MKQIKLFDSREKALENLIENKPFTVSINGLKICLVRNNSGISAFKSTCPHAGASLSEGFVNFNNEIVCPLHGYRFNIFDGSEKSGHSCELFIYGLELRDDGLFITLR
ncbi:MAG: Rieske (2Fe-2S) protein [Opitutaceae bacterium]|nr:Rieske (2Fe-2S) protein [Cytophagales bacterium]